MRGVGRRGRQFTAGFWAAVTALGLVVLGVTVLVPVAGARLRGRTVASGLFQRHDVGGHPYGYGAHGRGPRNAGFPHVIASNHTGLTPHVVRRMSARGFAVTGGPVAAFSTATSRTYPVGNGAYVARVFPYPVNYLRDGHWAAINDTLVRAGDTAHPAGVGYGLSLPMTFGRTPVRMTATAGSVALTLLGAHSSEGQLSGDQEAYRNVIPGVSARYAAGPEGVKESLTLASSQAMHSFHYALALSKGLRPVQRGNGIDVVSSTGRVVFVLAAPFMYEQAAGPQNVSDRGAVTMTLARGAGGWTVTLAADRQWLSTAGRKFPVVIDPSLFDPSADASASTDCTLVSGSSASTSSCDSTGDDNVGYNGSTADRALMQFNLQGVLPADANVEEADLSLTLDTSSTSTSTQVGAYALTRGFTSAATWNTYDGTHAWTTAGGDFGTQLSTATISPATDSASNYTWSLMPFTQRWLDGSSQNFGVLLKEPTETTNNVLSFYSANELGSPPDLQIYYVPRTGYERGMTYQSQQLDDRATMGVNVADGNLLLQTKDLNISGTGLPETITRSYNNLDSEPGTIADDSWKLSLVDTQLDVSNAFGDYNGVVTYIDPSGTHFTFNANGSGGFTAPPGVDATLAHNSDSTWTLTYRDNTKYNFSSPGQLTSIVDKNGNKLTAGYTTPANFAGPNLTSLTDTQGRVTKFAYDPTTNNLTSITDPSGRTITYKTNSNGWLSSATDTAGHATSYSYDSSGDLTQITDPDGHVTKVAYDSTGRVLSVTRVTNNSTGAGDTTSYAYVTPGTTITGTSSGCPAPGQGATAFGQTVVTDPRGNKTTYCYDTHDRVFATYDAQGHKRSNTYSPDDNVTQFGAPSGADTNVGYDNQDRPFQAQLPVSSSSPTQKPAAYGLQYNSGSTHPYLPDSSSDPQGNTVSYGYDSAQDLTSITDGLSSQNGLSFTYNSNGTVATSTDADHNQTIYSYTGGNLTSIVAPTATGGLGVTTLGYDSLSRLTSIKDGKGQTETITYDGDDRPLKETFADGSTITYTYDADGNLTQQVDSVSGTSTYTYDNKNRITQEALPGGHTNTYAYDGNNNLTSVTNPNGTTTYGYDNLNRLTSVQQPGQTGAITMAYNQDDRRTSIAYPNKVNITMGYDPAGHMLSDVATGPGGAIASLTYVYTQGTADRDVLESRTDNKTGQRHRLQLRRAEPSARGQNHQRDDYRR